MTTNIPFKNWTILLIIAVIISACAVNSIEEKEDEIIDVPDLYLPEPDSTNCDSELGWVVTLTLKSQPNGNYSITEHPDIKSLVLKHNVLFFQRSPGAKNPELLLYYILRGKNCDKRNTVIRAFLTTGMFKDSIVIHEIVYIDPI